MLETSQHTCRKCLKAKTIPSGFSPKRNSVDSQCRSCRSAAACRWNREHRERRNLRRRR